MAAIFAVHPLHVESVAWVTERKDVLCGLFFLLTLAAYLALRGTGPFSNRASASLFLAIWLCSFASSRPGSQAHGGYPAVLALVVGLLAAADGYTAARRCVHGCFRPRGPIPIPLFGVSGKRSRCWRSLVSFAWWPSAVRRRGLEVNQQYSLAWRIGNALISYVAYLGQFFCPAGLAPCYPRRPVLAALAGGRGRADAGCRHGGGDRGGGGSARTCWSAGSGISGCWCPSSGWCSLAPRPRPTGSPICRRSACHRAGLDRGGVETGEERQGDQETRRQGDARITAGGEISWSPCLLVSPSFRRRVSTCVSGGPRRLRLASGILLARQRDPLDPRSRLRLADSVAHNNSAGL